VHGRVLELREEPHPQYSNVRTLLVKLEVVNNLRGAPGRTFTFRQHLAGGRSGWFTRRGKAVTPKLTLSNTVQYRPGREVLLFLYPASKVGLTSPVGGIQGRFRVVRDSKGRSRVINGVENRGLFEGVETTAQKRGIKLSRENVRILRQRSGPVETGSFLNLVRTLRETRQ
jgi:hypothetical protein